MKGEITGYTGVFHRSEAIWQRVVHRKTNGLDSAGICSEVRKEKGSLSFSEDGLKLEKGLVYGE